MSEYGLSIWGSYDGMNDNELDDIVTGILKDFPKDTFCDATSESRGLSFEVT